ncbi:hypothetical protein CC78DRAFT_198202 [Lojkania enalia]|uniref:Uncharacterized protein n=1 Tax=Lojkania enalia TaxID=147567 RepID=A0A9P4NBW4_9PLEO|nr:hypothetical protein CC78DRAFT_198202 [Didymosphaeria enalia]
MSPALVSAYTAVHVVTLCFVSLTVLNIFLPIRIDSVVPLIPDWKLDPSRLCRDLDNAWDEDWVERCRTSFAIVETGLAAVAVVLMGAQWWALGRVWRWGAGLQTEEYRRRNEKEKLDVEADVSEKWERR